MTDFQKLKTDLSAKKLREAQLTDQLNEKKELLNESIKKMQTEFDNSNAELINDNDAAHSERLEAEETLRSALIDNYQLTGTKQVSDGLSVRVNTKLIYDKTQAFNWAKEHSLALKLDEQAFEKIAGSTHIDFVNIEEKPIAVLSSRI